MNQKHKPQIIGNHKDQRKSKENPFGIDSLTRSFGLNSIGVESIIEKKKFDYVISVILIDILFIFCNEL